MKKIIFCAILFLGLSTVGFSQERPQRVQKSPEERAQRITDALDKKLSLTESQKTQIYQINLERAQAMSGSRGAKKDEAARAEMKQRFDASESRILSVLNESQRATYSTWKTERESNFKNHKGQRKQGFRNKA